MATETKAADKAEIKKEKRTPENQAEYFYNQRTLHMILLLSSIALIGACALMVYKDYARPWKEFQRAYHNIEIARVENELESIEEGLAANAVRIDTLKRAINEWKKGLKKSMVDANLLWRLFNVKKAIESAGAPLGNIHEISSAEELEKFVSSQKGDLLEACRTASSLDLIGETKNQLNFAIKQLSEGEYPARFRARASGLFERLGKVLNAFSGRLSFPESESQMEALEGIYQVCKQDAEFAVATYTLVRWKFEEAKHALELSEKDPSIDRSKAETEFRRSQKEFSDIQKEVDATKIIREPVENFRRNIKFALKMHMQGLEALESQLAALIREKSSAELRIKNIKDSLTNKIRNAPMLDFFGPTMEVKQVILANVYDELHFATPQRIDRCHTCHVTIDNPLYKAFIDKEGGYKFENDSVQKAFETAYPNKADRDRYIKVLMAHPRLELYASSTSPHPLNKVGCTSCHDGDGKETDFSLAVHTPAGEQEAKVWKKLYGYRHRELWDHPMLPPGTYEASCRRCHDKEMELAGAKEYNLGMQVYERAGCYACHKTDSYPALDKHLKEVNGEKDDTRLSRRPGPPLTNISTKVSKEWAYNWILSPRSFRPVTRMPHFFLQPNSRDLTLENGHTLRAPEQDFIKAAAITEYIFSLGEGLETAGSSPAGDVARGERIVSTVGCLACHKLDENYEKDYFVKGTPLIDEFGPNLAGAAEKFNNPRGKAWLYSWLKNPRHYFGESRMPDMRLTDQEAADITAYLTSEVFKINNDNRKLRGLAGWYPQNTPLNVTGDNVTYAKSAYSIAVEDLLLTEFKRNMTLYDAKSRLRSLSDKEKVMALGRELVKAYGCYSCHEMTDRSLPDAKQWMSLEGIGVELTGAQPWGSKFLDRLDFGMTRYDHHHTGVVFRHPLNLHEIFRGHDPVNINQLNSFERDKEGRFIIKIPYTRHDWLINKLLNPRVYDAGLLASKPSDELTRMPNFNLTAEEARLAAIFVLSFTNHLESGVTKDVRKELSARELSYQNGLRYLRDFNCAGCHVVEPDKLGVATFRALPAVSTQSGQAGGGGRLETVKLELNGIVDARFEFSEDMLGDYCYNYIIGSAISPLLAGKEISADNVGGFLESIVQGLDKVDVKSIAAAVKAQIDAQGMHDSHYGTSYLPEKIRGLTLEAITAIVDEKLLYVKDDMQVALDAANSGDAAEVASCVQTCRQFQAKRVIDGALYTAYEGADGMYYAPHYISNGYRILWIVDNRTLLPDGYQLATNVVYDPQLVSFKPKVGGDLIPHLIDYKLKHKEEGVVAGQEQQIVPPYLFTQGRKTQPQWLFNFLKNPYALRTSLLSKYDAGGIPLVTNVRMPTFHFNDRQARVFVEFFNARDVKVSLPQYARREASVAGQYEFVVANLPKIIYMYEMFQSTCRSCHKINGIGADMAPDLINSADRLKEDWMFHFFNDPAKVYPKTPMPQPNTITPLTGSFDTARADAAKIVMHIPAVEQVVAGLTSLREELGLIRLACLGQAPDENLLKYHLKRAAELAARYIDLVTYERLDEELQIIFNREPTPQEFSKRIETLASLAPLYSLLKDVGKASILKLLENKALETLPEAQAFKKLLRGEQ